MAIQALEIARYIITKSSDIGKPVSNLKLQKLLYYVQGWYLGLEGVPVFTDNIQAWVHGPVVPTVFFCYKAFKWNPISENTRPGDVEVSFTDHIDAVLAAYDHMTAAQLEKLSHEESPWREARGSLPPTESSKAVISHESMKEYFRNLANESDKEEHPTAYAAAR